MGPRDRACGREHGETITGRLRPTATWRTLPDAPDHGPSMVSRVQAHHFFVDIAATPDELWELFWLRRALTQNGDVTIEILHPGNDIGEGLVRHCTFRVPRYLLSGGRGQSWEWLTDVTPKVSWKYNAVGKPLWSQAEGRTRLEDLGDGQTRVHFSETYRAFNPVMRVLLEKRVHDFISKDNDRLIKDSLTKGVQMMRAARTKGTSDTP
jgi:hypothetical protein